MKLDEAQRMIYPLLDQARESGNYDKANELRTFLDLLEAVETDDLASFLEDYQ